MKRQISSRLSLLYTRVFPVFIALFAVVMLRAFIDMLSDSGEIGLTVIVLIAVTAISLGFLMMAWHLARVKRVWIDESALHVKGFRRSYRVGFDQVDTVTATRFFSPELITVRFRSGETEPDAFSFIPPMRLFHLFSQHPLAEEIRQIVHQSVHEGVPYTPVSPPFDWRRFAKLSIGFAVAFLGVSVIINEMLRSSEAYAWSLEQVQTDPAVRERLGAPVEAGFWVNGSYSSGEKHGSADLSYKVTGPEGTGKVTVRGKMKDGHWTYEKAGVAVRGDFISFGQE